MTQARESRGYTTVSVHRWCLLMSPEHRHVYVESAHDEAVHRVLKEYGAVQTVEREMVMPMSAREYGRTSA
jgi:hypothetical protein